MKRRHATRLRRRQEIADLIAPHDVRRAGDGDTFIGWRRNRFDFRRIFGHGSHLPATRFFGNHQPAFSEKPGF
jgi:hypothetical protein